jgi:hypothetical protein
VVCAVTANFVSANGIDERQIAACVSSTHCPNPRLAFGDLLFFYSRMAEGLFEFLLRDLVPGEMSRVCLVPLELITAIRIYSIYLSRAFFG